MKKPLHLLFCLALTSICTAQIPSPSPPTQESWHTVRLTQLTGRLRQPAPMPANGLWVVEDRPGTKSPTIVRFYNEQQQEIRLDTLARKRVDIRKKAVVNWLNNQLRLALDAQPGTYLVTNRPMR